MKSFLRKPVVWRLLLAMVMVAIAIRVSIWIAVVLWLVAAIREPKTFLYPFLLPLAVGAFYANKIGALAVGGSLIVFAIYRIWRIRRQPNSAALIPHADKSEGKGAAPQ